MNLVDGVADLHMHTTASDGTSPVADRVAQAHERNLSTIAITDHDTISETLTARTNQQSGVEVITGVEVRADLLDTKIELLGYFVDPNDDQLMNILAQVRQLRHKRNERMVARLAEEAGLNLSYETIRNETSGIVGRPHLADLLVDEGTVESVSEAFATYLGTDGAAYVEMERLPATSVLDAIHSAGGLASLAHPGRIRSDRVCEMVNRLVKMGLDALEVRYPYDVNSGPDAYADIGVDQAAALAAEYDLLETGGSDCHGPDSEKFRIGSVRVTEEALSRLRTTATQYR